MKILSLILFFGLSQIQLSEKLKIEPITETVSVHKSLLEIPNYGNYPCNGMVYFSGDSVFVFDTPTTKEQSQELLDWFDKENIFVAGLVVNHYHVDCTAGIDLFLERNIPVYSTIMTCENSKLDTVSCAENLFTDSLEIEFDGKKIINYFFGAAHTPDNIISYLPEENIIFGGCMIKAKGWGKGNLADADTSEWANTVEKAKDKFPEIKYIVPGHGSVGSSELFDYTIEMFRK